jgi:two-component system, chemotaxis family, sensor kinase CheA
VNLIQRLSIRVRLFLLAGVPVVGALLLAGLIAQDARQRAASTAALGSVEDLASLSAEMSTTLFALQTERARAALDEGASAAGETKAREALHLQYRMTDLHRARLVRLLDGRDLSSLPARLSRGLVSTRAAMASLPAFRLKIEGRAAPIDDILGFYGGIDGTLIAATAALSELSDDGPILRDISALVAILELSERVSAEQALLANVAVRAQFAPGLFKTLVTLGTEQSIYANIFRANAPDDLVRRWDAEQESSGVRRALAMREKTIATTDEVVELDAVAWFDAEQTRIGMLEAIATTASDNLTRAATRKVRATRASIRLGVGLSVAVLIVSTILALLIRRGISRSIEALSEAAAQVQATKNFAIRAVKTSDDELGMLADAFNEMLAGVQARDAELQEHKNNLESLVAARTEQLAQRNDAMRIVLDNVEQGLAMIRVDGTMQAERSAKFDSLLGKPNERATFAQHIGAVSPSVQELVEMGWETARDGFLPIEVAIDQLPKRIVRDGRHLTLDFRPVVHGDVFEGALLVVTDVTAEIEARAEQEKQSEYVAIFERVAQDRDGFVAFSEETGALLARLDKTTDDPSRVMTILHTVKGSAAQWGVSSVARIAHDLETQVVEAGELPTAAQRLVLATAWRSTTQRFRPVVGGAENRLELTRAELDDLLSDIRGRAHYDVLTEKVERLCREPAALRFQRMDIDIERLAVRLGKPRPQVVIEANGVRLSATLFGAFWTSMVHVVRNMIDHGIEPAKERVRIGKTEAGRILLRATESAERLTIECEDDGGGIDWDAVAAKAAAAGLPCRTREDVEAALFASGVSTARDVTEISGRGVGLSAVLESCRELGGQITVSSARGRGTRFVFSFARRTGGSVAPGPPVVQHAS